jgi:2-keto-4-pentenoate hydratase/2-oxohepta-3-ene-1,7-dioic acid hydratase in catechol pathway
MRIVRFRTPEGDLRTGCDHRDGTAALVSGSLTEGFTPTGQRAAVAELLAPVVPPAILCIGLNYRMHAAETGMSLPEYPILFMKNPGALTGPFSDIVIPRSCLDPPQVDYEVELAVVIGKTTRNIGPEKALDHVFGYAAANDVSARTWQQKGGGKQWVRGKSFDTFCPLGPSLVTRDEVPDPQDLEVACLLNDRVMQQSSTSDMIFSVAQLIAFLSESTTLLPGTLLLTGTPGGVGFTRRPPVFLKPGDRLETRVQGVGTLINPVVAEA